MSVLDEHLAEYLIVRRALGYKLERTGKLLAQFVAWLDVQGAAMITTELALEWATLPAPTESSWHQQRLTVIRGFAMHLHAIDPECEVPPRDLLAWRRRRRVPFLYSDTEIQALIAATGILGSAHRTATARTWVGLLAVTGMRVGEAIRLDQGDVDLARGLLVVRDTKFGKSRELALHPTTVRALGEYLDRADRPDAASEVPAVFVSATGTRLLYCGVQNTFSRLVAQAGIEPRSATCRPRLHDVRHTFAVRSLLDAYLNGDDVQARLPALSTYLGHVNPGSTYWYLQAAPELLALAGERLERHLDGDPR